jgi:hypothetical protein
MSSVLIQKSIVTESYLMYTVYPCYLGSFSAHVSFKLAPEYSSEHVSKVQACREKSGGQRCTVCGESRRKNKQIKGSHGEQISLHCFI